MVQAGFKEWPRKFVVIAAAIALLTVVAVAGIYKWRSGRNSSTSSGNPERVDNSLAGVVNPAQLALQKVEEDRGEPTGNKAQVNIPAELKLYKDRNRFLAIQVAEWRQQKYRIPIDFSELATMVRQGEFVVLPTLTPHYILYGVGLKANDELTHYDPQMHKSITLFSSEAQH